MKRVAHVEIIVGFGLLAVLAWQQHDALRALRAEVAALREQNVAWMGAQRAVEVGGSVRGESRPVGASPQGANAEPRGGPEGLPSAVASAKPIAMVPKGMESTRRLGFSERTAARSPAPTVDANTLEGGLASLYESPATASPLTTTPNWDHAQATGAPNTPQAGDRPTAWAPRTPRSGEHWLQLGYAKAAPLAEITIHETHSTGAVSRVTAIMGDGSERPVWSGNVARGAGNEIQETVVPVPPGITTDQIRVYVDTNRVDSWPEIDAVELVGSDGSRQWANRSSASSSYSDNYAK